MKLPRFILALLTCWLAGAPVSGLTVEELSSYLGVSSWQTVVDLPGLTYKVQIYEFANGALADHPLIDHEVQALKTVKADLLIVWGPQDDMYKLMIKDGIGATITVRTKTATFGSTASESLPNIGAGDYVIFGEPLGSAVMPQVRDFRTYSKGFLLRIKKS